MTKPNFWITEDNYFQITGPGYWKINEVPQERLNQLPTPFSLETTVGVFASGVPPYQINEPVAAGIAGVDWFRLEQNPKPNEPELNVYHFIIGNPVPGCGCPVYGPYRNGSIAPHWSRIAEIERY